MLKSIVFGLFVFGFASVSFGQYAPQGGYPVQQQQAVATQQVQVNEFNGVQQQAPVQFNGGWRGGATVRQPDVYHYHEHHVVNAPQVQYQGYQQYPQANYYVPQTQYYYPQQQCYQPQYYYCPQRSWWHW